MRQRQRSASPSHSGRVRKTLSRSSSECEIHARVRRKPCSASVSPLFRGRDEQDCSHQLAGRGVLPHQLLSCLSHLELSRMDEDSDYSELCQPDQLSRSLGTDGTSLLPKKISSAGEFRDLMERIRAPTTSAVLEERAFARSLPSTARACATDPKYLKEWSSRQTGRMGSGGAVIQAHPILSHPIPSHPILSSSARTDAHEGGDAADTLCAPGTDPSPISIIEMSSIIEMQKAAKVGAHRWPSRHEHAEMAASSAAFAPAVSSPAAAAAAAAPSAPLPHLAHFPHLLERFGGWWASTPSAGASTSTATPAGSHGEMAAATVPTPVVVEAMETTSMASSAASPHMALDSQPGSLPSSLASPSPGRPPSPSGMVEDQKKFFGASMTRERMLANMTKLGEQLTERYPQLTAVAASAAGTAAGTTAATREHLDREISWTRDHLAFAPAASAAAASAALVAPGLAEPCVIDRSPISARSRAPSTDLDRSRGNSADLHLLCPATDPTRSAHGATDPFEAAPATMMHVDMPMAATEPEPTTAPATAPAPKASPSLVPTTTRMPTTTLVPTAFVWTEPCTAAFLCGTFNRWSERIPMRRRTGTRGEWWTVLNLPPGEHAYKFVVEFADGEVGWRHAPDQPITLDASGQTNNWVAVADQEAYEREEDPGAYERGVVVGAEGEEEEEGGYSQIVDSEFIAMLFATEPPAAPPQLLYAMPSPPLLPLASSPPPPPLAPSLAPPAPACVASVPVPVPVPSQADWGAQVAHWGSQVGAVVGSSTAAAFASLVPHAVQDRMARPPPIAPPAPSSPVVDPVAKEAARAAAMAAEAAAMAAEAAALPFVPSHAVLEHLCWLIAKPLASPGRARRPERWVAEPAESLADGDGEARVMGSVAQTEEDVTRMESSEESSDGVLLFDDEGNDGGGFGSWSRSEALPPERAPPLAPACVLRATMRCRTKLVTLEHVRPLMASPSPPPHGSLRVTSSGSAWPFPRTLSSDVDAD